MIIPCVLFFSLLFTSQEMLAEKLNVSSDMSQFRKVLNAAKRIVVISGAGVSAESGVPTFRGDGGFWRKYVAQDLATHRAFNKSPTLVWEFYHYRRELVRTKRPNKAHIVLAEFEKRLDEEGKGRRLTIVTQNVDGLHAAAGSKRVIELHGSLFKTQCTKCGHVEENTDSPICEALRNRGEPNITKDHPELPVNQLPQCKQPGCHGLLRPYVVWFGDSLREDVLKETRHAVAECDLCLVVGTSSIVYPAAMFAQELAYDGVPVAEFNLEETAASHNFKFHFKGPCGETLPAALNTTE